MRPLEYGPIGSKLEGADRALEKSGPRILNIKVGFSGWLLEIHPIGHRVMMFNKKLNPGTPESKMLLSLHWYNSAQHVIT